MLLGPMIAAWRKENRYGTREIAKAIGISSATLNRIENGEVCDSDTMAKVLFWVLE